MKTHLVPGLRHTCTCPGPQRLKTYLLTCAPNEALNQSQHEGSQRFRCLNRNFIGLAIQNVPSEDSDHCADLKAYLHWAHMSEGMAQMSNA